jgi:hypothetical protein
MKVLMEARSHGLAVHTALAVAATVGVMLVLITPFMAIIAYWK